MSDYDRWKTTAPDPSDRCPACRGLGLQGLGDLCPDHMNELLDAESQEATAIRGGENG
jgi:hypothetical protein